MYKKVAIDIFGLSLRRQVRNGASSDPFNIFLLFAFLFHKTYQRALFNFTDIQLTLGADGLHHCLGPRDALHLPRLGDAADRIRHPYL